MNPGLKISVSGIRGIVGETLKGIDIMRFVSAFLARRRGKIVVGRDSRKSGVGIEKIVVGTAVLAGCDVVELGVVPTPTVGIMVREMKAIGGVVITASHNPEFWNGLKFLDETGCPISESEITSIVEIAEKGDLFWAKYNFLGKTDRYEKAAEVHIKRVLGSNIFDIEKIGKARFKVVYDGNSGAGCVVIPLLLERLGCEAILINENPVGSFAHKLEPTPDALVELGKIVRETGADIGLATDPDADRLAIVDENGAPISEEFTLAFAVDYFLSKRRSDVVTNLSTSSIIDYIANRHRVTVHRSKVGELNVLRLMTEKKATIGGEGNGGVIFSDVHCGRDAVSAAAFVLAYLAEKKKYVSEIVKDFPKFYMLKDKLEMMGLPDIAEKMLVESLKPTSIEKTDGIRFMVENGWVHIRFSNTEPVLRIIVESNSKEKSEFLLETTRRILVRFS